MSWLALILILAATAGFSTFDLLRKLLAERVPIVPLLFWLTAGAVPLYAGWWWWSGLPGVDSSYLIPGVGSATINVLANLAFLRSMQLSALSVTIPLLSLTPAFTALMAIPTLGEVPSLRQWVGVGVVVFGALALQTADSRVDALGWRRWSSDRGALMMIGVALLWSLAMPLDKLAVQSSSVPFHGLILHLGVMFGSGLVLLRYRAEVLAPARQGGGLLLAAVAAGALGLAFQLAALQHAYVGLIETLKRGLGSAAALALGWRIFGERLGARKVVAVVMMAAGVTTILL